MHLTLNMRGCQRQDDILVQPNRQSLPSSYYRDSRTLNLDAFNRALYTREVVKSTQRLEPDEETHGHRAVSVGLVYHDLPWK